VSNTEARLRNSLIGLGIRPFSDRRAAYRDPHVSWSTEYEPAQSSACHDGGAIGAALSAIWTRQEHTKSPSTGGRSQLGAQCTELVQTLLDLLPLFSDKGDGLTVLNVLFLILISLWYIYLASLLLVRPGSTSVGLPGLLNPAYGLTRDQIPYLCVM